MKISKKEIFCIEDLTKEELLFFFEVIDKMQLAPNSSAVAFSIAEKFKTFRNQLLDEGEQSNPSIQEPICDGCETLIDVKEQMCPAEGILRYLCPTCFQQRQHLINQLNAK